MTTIEHPSRVTMLKDIMIRKKLIFYMLLVVIQRTAHVITAPIAKPIPTV